MRCIYSWTELNEDEPPNAATRSKEHIVPWAIGGSNGLVTYDACKKWNRDFGSLIDDPFTNTLPIAIKRHELKIKGKSGTIPPIVWQLRSTENNEPANLVITADGNISFTVGPVVIDEEHSKFTKRLVTGSPDIVKRIFD